MTALVLLACEGSALNLFSLLVEECPGAEVPRVGDRLPLRAAKSMNLTIDGKDTVVIIPYLDGMYEVVEVKCGRIERLFPEIAPFRTLNKETVAHRITLKLKHPLAQSDPAIPAEIVAAFA